MELCLFDDKPTPPGPAPQKMQDVFVGSARPPAAPQQEEEEEEEEEEEGMGHCLFGSSPTPPVIEQAPQKPSLKYVVGVVS